MKIIPTILLISGCLCMATLPAWAQQENTAIRNGNQFYKNGQFNKAIPEYQKAIQENPQNPVPRYNLGNTQFRSGSYTDAGKTFEEAIPGASPDSLKAKLYYNNGVALSKQQKLVESIEAWKNALRLNPNDEDARFNLEKALSELKKQNQQQEQKPQQQKKQQKKQQQDKQKPPPSKLDKQKIEQYLQSLQQKEQDIQRKVQQSRTRSVTQPDKDW